MVPSYDEVKLAVAPCGSSEKNCSGWEVVSIFRSVCADRPHRLTKISRQLLNLNSSFQNFHMVLPQASRHYYLLLLQFFKENMNCIWNGSVIKLHIKMNENQIWINFYYFQANGISWNIHKLVSVYLSWFLFLHTFYIFKLCRLLLDVTINNFRPCFQLLSWSSWAISGLHAMAREWVHIINSSIPPFSRF